MEVQLPTTPTNRPAAENVATIGTNSSSKGTKGGVKSSSSGSKGMATLKRKIPADITDAQRDEIRALAVKAFKVLGCNGVSRIDFMMNTESGEIWLNEINTMPGFTSISMFHQMCNAGGLKYADLIEELIKLGTNRFEKKRELLTSR